jgi:hypothetical protein
MDTNGKYIRNDDSAYASTDTDEVKLGDSHVKFTEEYLREHGIEYKVFGSNAAMYPRAKKDKRLKIIGVTPIEQHKELYSNNKTNYPATYLIDIPDAVGHGFLSDYQVKLDAGVSVPIVDANGNNVNDKGGRLVAYTWYNDSDPSCVAVSEKPADRDVYLQKEVCEEINKRVSPFVGEGDDNTLTDDARKFLLACKELDITNINELRDRLRDPYEEPDVVKHRKKLIFGLNNEWVHRGGPLTKYSGTIMLPNKQGGGSKPKRTNMRRTSSRRTSSRRKSSRRKSSRRKSSKRKSKRTSRRKS